jgi:hexosaminidase
MWGTKGSKDYTAFERATKKIRETSGISLLDRAITPGADAVVWEKTGGDEYFIANTHKPLTSKKATTDNLEYPWTAEFTITRLSDTVGNDTLISSDLATFFVDLEYERYDKKKKTSKKERGVACVRAKNAPGVDPLTSSRPDVLVFNYQVPFNKKVTLKFVGERRSTSLYVDGKLIETKRIQMVCPLATLGTKSKTESFQGILHKAKISSIAILPPPPVFAGNWTPKHLKSIWTNLVMDISKKLTKAGEKTVILKYSKGGCRLDMKQVELLVDGKVVSADKHYGITGGSSDKNVYKVSLKKYSANAKYELRILVKPDGGTDSYGDVSISE